MEDKGISDVYMEELQSLYTKGYNFITEIPEFRSIKPSLYDARRKARGEENDSKTAQDIIFSEEIKKMEDGADFLLADKNDKDRIIVFASENGKDLLKNYKTFFVDGTFKSSSKQFKQLYTVHVDIGCSSEEINIITPAYALLNKKRYAYV